MTLIREKPEEYDSQGNHISMSIWLCMKNNKHDTILEYIENYLNKKYKIGTTSLKGKDITLRELCSVVYILNSD